MLTRCLTLIAIISIMSVVLSCSGTQKQSILEENWGKSFESINYMQMADPEAGKNYDPIVGLDGNASVNNVDKYQKSFEKTEQTENTTILRLQ